MEIAVNPPIAPDRAWTKDRRVNTSRRIASNADILLNRRAFSEKSSLKYFLFLSVSEFFSNIVVIIAALSFLSRMPGAARCIHYTC